MLKYALSIGRFGTTEENARLYMDALRRSRIRSIELSFGPFVEEGEISRIHRKTALALKQEGTLDFASVHLPFMGGGKSWDSSKPDEAVRKEVIARLRKMILENRDILAPNATFHCSLEPPLEEHPIRISQVRRSMEELLPLAEEFGFSINVEYLPRTCVGNSPEELEKIVAGFDPEHVGICMDVNHVMGRFRELPQLIERLGKYIRTFHISDYDGVDEKHWLPGMGIIDWPSVMAAIRALPQDTTLILEATNPSGLGMRGVNPAFLVRQAEIAFFYLENCAELEQRLHDFSTNR